MQAFGDLGILPSTSGLGGEGAPGPIFMVGEKVLVPHTDQYYEAKILKSEFRPDGLWYYFLHYTGAPSSCLACEW